MLDIYYLGSGRLRTPTPGETMYNAIGGVYKGTGDGRAQATAEREWRWLQMSRAVAADLVTTE